MSTALLFPGQGAQHVGMLRQLPDTPAAARTRAEARAALAALAAEDAEDAARPRDAGGLGADGAPCPHDALADLDAGNADLFAGSASLDAGEAARTRDAFGGPVAGDAAQLRDVGGAAAGEAARPRGPGAGDGASRTGDVLADLDGGAATSTTDAQLALLVAGVATARALVEDHGLRVDAVAGHSAGAFGAAVLAGVLDLGAALRVVRVRGAAMQRACAGGAWGMAAVRGLGRAAAQRLIDDVSTTGDPLWIANLNAADQIVVAGTRPALDALRGRAPAVGAHDLTDLAVTVASHGPLQSGTAAAVARALAGEAHGEQRRAYFANATGRRLAHATGGVLDDLAQAVRQPVRWHDIVRLMPELGITGTVQVPPGHTLAALAARENPSTTNVAIDDLGIPAALHRLNREAMR